MANFTRKFLLASFFMPFALNQSICRIHIRAILHYLL